MNRRFFLSKAIAFSAALPLSKFSMSNGRYIKGCETDKACAINIEDYGCRAHRDDNEYFDNRIILQNIIDTCAILSIKRSSRMIIYIPKGTYYLSATSSNSGNKNIVGAFCLLMQSNLILKGEGTLKLLPNQYGIGAYFRILASENKIENCDIVDITLDGNSSSQIDGIQSSNILLECKANINIRNVRSINANGNGILIKGGVRQDQPVLNVSISDCFVNNCKKIGIQVSQFSGLKIFNNTVSHCNDNGIDIYGDLGRDSPNKTNGNHFAVFNNKVSFCLNGIFPETVSNGKIYDNILENLKESGVHVNRIHGLPQNISIERNQISNASSGMHFTGDMKHIFVENNKISEITDAFFSFGGGRGNASGIQVINNDIFLNESNNVLSSFSGEKIHNIYIALNGIQPKDDNSKLLLNRNKARVIDKNTVIVK